MNKKTDIFLRTQISNKILHSNFDVKKTVMSLTSKAVLGITCGLTAGTIIYVHYKQWSDKQKLHEGVIKDIERQRRKKIKNLYMLQQQQETVKILKNQGNQDDAVGS